MKAQRLDVFKIDNSSIERRPDGSIIVDALINRTGIQLYRRRDGKVKRELRKPSEVFDRRTLDSFKLITVTNEHPRELVTVDNKNIYSVGTTGENIEIIDNQFTRCKLMINDKKTIEDIESGSKVEISCGYTADIDETPGIDPQFGEFDSQQRNIVGNHVAIVRRGRAGSKVRIRVDSEDGAVLVSDDEFVGGKLMKIKILKDGKEVEVEVADEKVGAEIQACIDSLVSDNKKLDGEVKTKQEELDEKKKKVDEMEETIKADESELTTKLQVVTADRDQLKEKVDSFDKIINDSAKERANLIADASAVCDEDTVKKFDSMSNSEIKIAVIKTKLPKMDSLEGKSDSEIDLAYQMTGAIVSDNKNSFKKFGQSIVDGRQDSVLEDASDKSAEAAISHKNSVLDAWQNKEDK